MDKSRPSQQSMARHGNASASERVVRDIVKGLYEKRYVPGQRLAEVDLVEQYGVSRTTVREAVKRLSVQGVVEILHNKGARIKNISKTEARNILLITELIVGLAARLAAENIEAPSAADNLKEALSALIRVNKPPNRYDFIRQRNHFHRTLARLAQSPEIENILANLQVHLVRNRLVMNPEERARSYENIADKVLAGDAPGAEKAARAHVRTMIELLDQQEKERESFDID